MEALSQKMELEHVAPNHFTNTEQTLDRLRTLVERMTHLCDRFEEQFQPILLPSPPPPETKIEKTPEPAPILPPFFKQSHDLMDVLEHKIMVLVHLADRTRL